VSVEVEGGSKKTLIMFNFAVASIERIEGEMVIIG